MTAAKPQRYIGDGYRLCRHCKTPRPLDEFSKDGKTCRDCRVTSYYGLDVNALLFMRQWQDNKCDICGREPSGIYPDVLCVDHDHGKEDFITIRALLCRNCNAGIGAFYDNPETLEKAAVYIRRRDKSPSMIIDDHFAAMDFMRKHRRREGIVDGTIIDVEIPDPEE